MKVAMTLKRRPSIALMVLSLLGLSVEASSQTHQHAHVHGLIELGVAIDGTNVVVDIDSPMDSLLGFEHTPRTTQQKQAASQWAQRLKAPQEILRFNPEAGCTVREADLLAPILGLGSTSSAQQAKQVATGHAELEGSWTFECTSPQALKQLDIGFFRLSPHAKQIRVQWANGNKQGKATLKRPQSTLDLSR